MATNTIQYVVHCPGRRGYIITSGHSLIINFAGYAYTWKQESPWIKFPHTPSLQIAEIGQKDEGLLSRSASLLDKTFGASHIPRFNPSSLKELVSQRQQQGCGTIALLLNETMISIVGWELRQDVSALIK